MMKPMRTFSIPATRDPFVNTPLTPIGRDPNTGAERFFISTWNANVGCINAMVDTNGNSRIYHCPKGEGYYTGCGAYSTAMTDEDTIWLITQIAHPVRLTLSTGEYEFFDSGARPGLVFTGTQYDAPSGKFLAVSCQYERVCALSFDTRTQKTVKIYEDFTNATYLRGGFPNPDGKTYTIRMFSGKSCLCQWDPARETLTERCEIDERANCYKVIYDEAGRVYIPYTGWLDTADYSIKKERMPEREACWFGRNGDIAYGMTPEESAGEILAWDMKTGKVRTLCTVPDLSEGCAALTERGEILVVNMYGMLYQFDAATGALRMTRTLNADAQGRLDCLLRVNETMILGTPYITQRFWLIDAETGEGFDAGRAAPNTGEVLRVWNLRGKVYMATYTEGVLTEFDPAARLNYPENPRIVAMPRHSMRPFAHAQDENCLYYSCNHPYGEYGCELTRYNAATGEAFYRDDPVPLQELTALCMCDGFLLGSTTTAADCDCLAPKTDRCAIVRICPDTLSVTHKTETEVGCAWSQLFGAIDEDSFLVMLRGAETRWMRYSLAQDALLDYALPQGYDMVCGTEYPGLFLLSRGGYLSLWRLDCNGAECLEARLAPLNDVYSVHPSGDSILLAATHEIHLLDHVLAEYINR